MVEEFIQNYGMLAIFLIVMLEYACFPLPSEVVLPIAGAIAITKNIFLLHVILLTTVAGFIGTMICYFIGFYGGYPLIEKIKTKYKKTSKGIDASIINYKKYENYAVCFGRIVPLCRTYISFIAGASRQNVFKYMFLSTIGIAIWNIILITLGYLFYDNLGVIFSIYRKYKIVWLIVISLLVLSIVIIIIIRRRKQTKK